MDVLFETDSGDSKLLFRETEYPMFCHFSLQMYKELYGEFFNTETLTIIPTLARTKSRGFVQLKSKNPFDTPAVDLNYFDHQDDMKLMIKGKSLW